MAKKKVQGATIVRKKKIRTRRKMTPFVRFLCFGVLAFSAWLLYGVIQEFQTTAQLQRNLAEAKEKLEEVQDENEYLIAQKDKLQDPNYVQSYARSNYMLTKEGEQIFYLPSVDK
ncbi:MAG: FtsB family cell division protein [Anaerorhabdus sp.]